MALTKVVMKLSMILSMTLTTAAAIPTNNPPQDQPCTCYNPFLGTSQQIFGAPEFSCQRTGFCFVPCDEPCSDKEQMSGVLQAICSSTRACSSTTTPSTPTTTRSTGQQLCLCKTPPTTCSKCEVDCLADCNDIAREGEGKCFSKAACSEDLLFEFERKSFDLKNFLS